ncbi:MAG: DUF1178 family protein [Alsobacter sp.]
MIRYALACEAGHDFESWFRDSDSFDTQLVRGLVTCPQCGSVKVAKQIMAPSVARTDLARQTPVDEVETAARAQTQANLPAVVPEPASAPMVLMGEREQAFRALLRAVRSHVEATAEHVGPRFAEEARRMHEGVVEFRAIYGEATAEEALALAEEGIDVMPLPRLPDERN